MENVPSTQSNMPNTIPNTPKLSTSLWIFLGAMLVLIALAVLSYLKIPPFSKLSALTQKINPQTALQQNKSAPASSVKITLSCPVSREFCQKGKELAYSDFYGLGFNLPKGTKILAAFTGKIDDKPKTPGRLALQPLLYLKDTAGNEAIYSYYGTVSTKLSKEITAGTEIGEIGPGNFTVSPLVGSNFVLALKKNGVFQKITPQTFGQ